MADTPPKSDSVASKNAAFIAATSRSTERFPTPPSGTSRAALEFLGKLPPGDLNIVREASAFTLQLLRASKDPVFLILRIHLLTEAYLERLIRLNLDRGDRIIDEGGLGYYRKLVLVHSFDQHDDRIVQCLKNLNKIRNRCAHEVETKITMSDVEVIGQPLGRYMVKARRESKGDLDEFLARVLGLIVTTLIEGVVSRESFLTDDVDRADPPGLDA